MQFNTKYNFKDKVYPIIRKTKQIIRTCTFCGGKGRIKGKDSTEAMCPKCYGKRVKANYTSENWRVGNQLTIGEVRIEARCEHHTGSETIFDNYGDQEEKYKEQYMCYETGIGSGTLWDADNLFSSELMAQQECDKRNKEEKN